MEISFHLSHQNQDRTGFEHALKVIATEGQEWGMTKHSCQAEWVEVPKLPPNDFTVSLTHLLPALGTGSEAHVVIQIVLQLDQAVGFPTEIGSATIKETGKYPKLLQW